MSKPVVLDKEEFDEDLLELIDHLNEGFFDVNYPTNGDLFEIFSDLKRHYTETGSADADLGYDIEFLPLSISELQSVYL